MTKNNTHKCSVWIQIDKKMIGKCLNRTMTVQHFYIPMALTVKWIREQRVDTVKLKIWNHQKRQRENHNELQD